jgi:antitoxin VapB
MKTAKLFKNGRSQAVRLPKEFQFSGNEVRIRRIGQSVILEPVEADLRAAFEKIDAIGREIGEFMPDGRNQPPMPPPKDIF